MDIPTNAVNGEVKSSISKVIVLGAAGFVGRHVARALNEQGLHVIGIGHGSWSKKDASSWGVSTWVKSDIGLAALNSLGLSEPPLAIIHCGGSGTVSSCYESPLLDFQRTVQSTATVLEWIRLNGRGRCRFVLASSASVFGDCGDTDATESSPPSPISPYGYHKVAAERECEAYSNFFDAPTSIVRLFSVYGEELRKQLLWDALNKYQAGHQEFFGTGDEIRDWIHVEDAADLLTTAALAKQSGLELYNGGHEQMTIREVLRLLAKAYGSDGEPKFNGKTHTGNPRRLSANYNHTSRSLGWTPKITLSEGIPRYVEWFSGQVVGKT